MNSYNGFTPFQRTRGGNWMRAMLAAGKYPPATKCRACAQTEGTIMYHSEDYSEPYGDHIFEFPLCYPCHMMIHCRHRNRRAWEIYTRFVAEGRRVLKPFAGSNWARFTAFMAGLHEEQFTAATRSATDRTVLDDIGEGLYDPRRAAPATPQGAGASPGSHTAA